mgnify:CR=1 FL=1
MGNITKNIYSKLFPENDILSKAEIDLMMQNSRTVSFINRDIIFRQETLTSHAMFVVNGFVKLYKEGRNNKTFILKIATPGNFLGMISIYGGGVFNYSASAINNAEIMFIDIGVFNSIIENNGRYTQHLLKTLAKDNLFMFDRLISQYQKQLPGKIADVILYFAENIYHSESYELSLTRTELAELAGTTKESFIRTLTEFRNDKIIDLDGKFLKINSMDILKTLSKIG